MTLVLFFFFFLKNIRDLFHDVMMITYQNLVPLKEEKKKKKKKHPNPIAIAVIL